MVQIQNSMEEARKNANPQAQKEAQVKSALDRIKYKFIVMSGKGGVGKTSTTVNLSLALAELGHKVGVMDVDLHGPDVPRMLGLSGMLDIGANGKLNPISYSKNLSVVSIESLTPTKDEAIIWRGPVKYSAIQQFIADVEWGDLDYLVTDCPPGTGDEPLSIAQLLGKIDGAVIVTTPQQIAVVDVKKCITFCRQLNLPVLGVIENMSGFICPHCSQPIEVFAGDGGREMARDFGVPFLGKIPIDPALAHA